MRNPESIELSSFEQLNLRLAESIVNRAQDSNLDRLNRVWAMDYIAKQISVKMKLSKIPN